MFGSSSAIADRRVAVRTTRDARRQVHAGHPWVFERSITAAGDGAPGDLAVVFDDHRRFVAIGLWDPTSPIRVRVLHHGAPRTIDREFFVDRLAASLERRRSLLEDATTTGVRLVNGESDQFPGLVADRYERTVVVKLYTVAWLPHLRMLTELLTEQLAAERIVLRLSRGVASSTDDFTDGTILHGSIPQGPIEFLECGLTFGADVVHGHKTGHFLDQRDNRCMVSTRTADAEVLDVFASTGGFSVHAAAGGASAVTAIDVSRPALDEARANMARNDLAVPFTVRVGDAFEELGALASAGRQWDVVVVDPPSFTPRQGTESRALAAYRRLTAVGLALTRTGGLFVQSSCSARITADTFHDQIDLVAAEAAVSLDDIARTGHPVDHPATFPQAHYLKTRFAAVLR